MLQKQSLNINFSQGLDTKTDPKQVQIGKMLTLENTQFQKGGLLQKRNGYAQLTAIPTVINNQAVGMATYLTTLNNNLTAVANRVVAYSQGTQTWLPKGNIQPLKVNTVPLIRTANSQTQVDAVVASNNRVFVVYTENAKYFWAILDNTTGQNLINGSLNTFVTAGTITGSPRVFLFNNNFVILLTITNGGNTFLEYALCPISMTNLLSITPSVVISQYSPHNTVAFDAVVFQGNTMYIAFNGTGDSSVSLISLNVAFVLSAITTVGTNCTTISLGASSSLMYAAFVTNTGVIQAFAFDGTFVLHSGIVTLGSTSGFGASSVPNIIVGAPLNVDIYIELVYASGNHQIFSAFLSPTLSIISALNLTQDSAGLASKAFIYNSTTCYLMMYFSDYQPTFFLIGPLGVAAKLAYSNAGGYLPAGLPNVTISGTDVYIPYLIKDQIQAVNKSQGLANPAGVYSQLGINLVDFSFITNYNTTEIANTLNLSGGYLWQYDGNTVAEQGFHIWPEITGISWSATGGAMAAKPDGVTNTNAYYYQAVYEWTDAQGNINRSAPSLPVGVTTTGSGASGSVSITIKTSVPTLKDTSTIKVVIYRWSVGQQQYYETNLQGFSLNVPMVIGSFTTFITGIDITADSFILGNELIYTTGGVIENIGPPPTDTVALFKSRLFLVDGEDKNLLWYSKQVIENTPVEMSDLLTIYVAPTISNQTNTGPITALSALDDKLIIFKQNSIFYITGNGPDNTGGNNDFSDPVFIASTVGCTNQHSIVLTPQGLMFQSSKGIWLLGRDLSTTYIGAPVEDLTSSATVLSALNMPETNQIRFTLDSNITLMYDYYYQQWGTFTNIPGISSTLYQNVQAYLDSTGKVYQETIGTYLDGTSAISMKFTTAWVNLSNLQGYQRAYYFYLLGQYITPHTLTLQIAYDYDPTIVQTTTITPDITSTIEQWRVFLDKQKCESFQITLTENYDPQYAITAGAGLTISGLNLVVGGKKGYPTLRPSNSTG